ncbi:MAG: T9SS type A sorting domain-containing protein [Flavobacteriales bacterium]
MNRTITLSICLVASTAAVAQCTSAVPGSVAVINNASAAQIPGSGGTYWVCGDAFQKIFTGSNNQIWIESGAFVSINGGSNTIYYKGNFLGVLGSNNTIYAQSVSSISDQGTNNMITACGTGAVVFNYTSAPGNGCSGVGVEEQAEVELQLYPNPVDDMLTIISGTAQVEEVRIADLSGREVAVRAGTGLSTIPMTELARGTYLVRIATDRGTVLRRVNKY